MASTAMLPAMRAIVLDAANDPWLEERRRLDLDRCAEVWDGVLHVVPPANFDHQVFESELHRVLYPLATAAKLMIVNNVGVYDPAKGTTNFRVPDISIVDRRFTSRRGIEGRAEL